MRLWLRFLLALLFTSSITACGPPARGGGDDDDSSASGDDDDSVEEPSYYGPENSWDHALAAEVPADLVGTGFRTGDVATNFVLHDQFDAEVELYQFYGKVIVLDVFAQWCGPCQENAPHGQAFWDAYSDQGAVLLALMQENNAGQGPSVTNAQEWVESFSLTHPVLADPDQLNIDYIVTGYPTFIVIDQTMTIRNDDLWPFDDAYVEGILNEG